MSILNNYAHEIPNREPWQEQALCTQIDPEMWFPEKGLEGIETARQAKRVCLNCPVREQCLDYAVRNRIEHGIFGGCTQRERRGLKPGQKLPPRTHCHKGHDLAVHGLDRRDRCRKCNYINGKNERERRRLRLEREMNELHAG